MYSTWTRGSLKSKAKDALRGNYWKAFIVSLVLAIISGGSSTGANNASKAGEGYNGGSGAINEMLTSSIIKWAIIIAIVTIVVLIIRLIIGYAIEVGTRKFFVKSSQGESDMNDLLYGFKDNRYMNILKTMFTRDIYLFLWTLLFIIPGIIKSYSYRMVPYILADNPDIDRKRAIELSREMTKGQKLSIFVLELSFIGWYILGFLALFIGMFFVLPYVNATDAELYLTVREDAINNGLTTREELRV